MARDLNQVTIIGNATRDPELRYTPGGAAVIDLGIASNSSYTTKDGEVREDTTFLDVTAWNKLAELIGQYVTKGKKVCVVGRLKMDSWVDKNTQEKRSKLKVEAQEVYFLSPKDGSASFDPAEIEIEGEQEQEQEEEEEAPSPPPKKSSPPASKPAGPPPAKSKEKPPWAGKK